ncbi:MAG: TraM recognition domain-containing protein, partial [Candidatus Peribacteraceae bacterium]|nr:TraM recognition domain-containing protein [Candidatus Peribacteraceae bacterium]
MSRADIPEDERRDFYLYVDEFQNFATESFATILSEARKYRLNLTMANQYVAQLLIGDNNTKLRDAVFGNVGTLISFQVGSDDAEVLSLQFEEEVTPKDILSLPKYHAYARLMVDGMPSKPFSVSTLPPPEYKEDQKRIEKLKSLSRERYSERREIVEDNINRWSASAAEGKNKAKDAAKAKEKGEEEMKKARKKGMKLDEYRKWRDREMWINDFNMIRKRSLLGETLSEADQKSMKDLEAKLKDSGGVPEVSKGLQQEIDKKQGKA